jgi:hypothetical protein
MRATSERSESGPAKEDAFASIPSWRCEPHSRRSRPSRRRAFKRDPVGRGRPNAGPPRHVTRSSSPRPCGTARPASGETPRATRHATSAGDPVGWGHAGLWRRGLTAGRALHTTNGKRPDASGAKKIVNTPEQAVAPGRAFAVAEIKVGCGQVLRASEHARCRRSSLLRMTGSRRRRQCPDACFVRRKRSCSEPTPGTPADRPERARRRLAFGCSHLRQRRRPARRGP